MASTTAAVVAQEEGIVAKQLETPWKADDKSGAWLKLKPDYFDMQEVRVWHVWISLSCSSSSIKF
jgi:ATP-dependent DNA ligase